MVPKVPTCPEQGSVLKSITHRSSSISISPITSANFGFTWASFSGLKRGRWWQNDLLEEVWGDSAGEREGWRACKSGNQSINNRYISTRKA